jgi:hypothetical protein
MKNAGKVNSIFGKLPSSIDGNSQIKTDGSKYYVVDKSGNYIDVTNDYKTWKSKGSNYSIKW